MSVTVINARCPQNHPCPVIRACPAGAVSQQGFKAPVIDAAKCTECGKCARMCPSGAFNLDK